MDQKLFYLNMLIIMITALFLCVACEKKSVVCAVEKMYDEGIARVQKAEDMNDTES